MEGESMADNLKIHFIEHERDNTWKSICNRPTDAAHVTEYPKNATCRVCLRKLYADRRIAFIPREV
jgi:hypothetical protein